MSATRVEIELEPESWGNGLIFTVRLYDENDVEISSSSASVSSYTLRSLVQD